MRAKEERQKSDWLVTRRPGSPVLFFIVMLTVLAIGWSTDYKSCKRQQTPREAVTATAKYFIAQANRLEQRVTFDVGKAKILDMKAASEARTAAAKLKIKHLKCLTVFPPT